MDEIYLQESAGDHRAEKTLEEAWKPLHDALWTEYQSVSPEAVPSALAIFKLTDGDFKRGIIYSGNFGSSDTISAIVGAISGAKNGMKAIPQSWVDKSAGLTSWSLSSVHKGDELFDVSRQLAALIK